MIDPLLHLSGLSLAALGSALDPGPLSELPAFAQVGDSAVNPFINMFPIFLILGFFYFLVMRPQQKRAQEHQQMLDGLKKGDMVVTVGGIHGKIHGLTDEVISLEVSEGNRIRIDKSRIERKQTESA